MTFVALCPFIFLSCFLVAAANKNFSSALRKVIHGITFSALCQWHSYFSQLLAFIKTIIFGMHGMICNPFFFVDEACFVFVGSCWYGVRLTRETIPSTHCRLGKISSKFTCVRCMQKCSHQSDWQLLLLTKIPTVVLIMPWLVTCSVLAHCQICKLFPIPPKCNIFSDSTSKEFSMYGAKCAGGSRSWKSFMLIPNSALLAWGGTWDQHMKF